MKKLSVIFVLAVFALPAFADSVHSVLNKMDFDPGFVLKNQDLRIAEVNDELIIVTRDSRYVFQGTVVDAWEKKEIKTLEAFEKSLNTLNLGAMGIQPGDLNSISIGSGNRQITVFTDPKCTYCHAVMSAAEKVVDESNSYTFTFVVIPALGGESRQLSPLVSCSSESDTATYSALKRETLIELQQATECDRTIYEKTLTTADALGISGVPYLIRDDGQVHRGRPANLGAWLEKGDNDE